MACPGAANTALMPALPPRLLRLAHSSSEEHARHARGRAFLRAAPAATQWPRLSTPRSAISALNLRDSELVVRVPTLLPEALRREMASVVLPRANRRLVDEIRHRDAKAIHPTSAFGTEAARLLEGELEHDLRHGPVSMIAFRPLRREYDGVIGRLRCPCETCLHVTPPLNHANDPRGPLAQLRHCRPRRPSGCGGDPFSSARERPSQAAGRYKVAGVRISSHRSARADAGSCMAGTEPREIPCLAPPESQDLSRARGAA